MDFDQVRRDWTTLGARDPLWAVSVAPDKRGGRWDVDEFLAQGRRDVARAREWLAALGLPTEWERVLDFGCGAGRLSQALAEFSDEVVGVDVSVPMLETARALDHRRRSRQSDNGGGAWRSDNGGGAWRSDNGGGAWRSDNGGGARRSDNGGGTCRFVLNEAPDLHVFPSGSFDLVYSELVLQHLPWRVTAGYLAEFVRVLRPGAVALVQCTTRPMWTVKGVVWRVAPRPVVRLAQRVLLGYPAPMLMTAVPAARLREVVRAHGGEVVDTSTTREPATHWVYSRYVIRKLAGER
ncbi:class I SAM-dependent methyltransferase [Saccharothrix deserti]|uniref:class I SAM-dependent methyltransferase n=1 Tax=Saccharothrix deserti TaxID=2593674 RepID=UPI00131B0B64|nr:class I SAM-dependent methyltransferase [Saccharothrix deserti]